MSQVDILRFVANVQQLFAPSIHEGQTFIAYLDEEDNSYLIQGDNLSFEGSGTLGGSIDKLQQNLDALQATINELSENSSSSAITIVDDIVYAYDDSSLNPPILTALKGRPVLAYRDYGFFLVASNYLANSNWDNNIQLSDMLSEGNVYAGFGDGKIHTITYSHDEDSYGITSAPISNGDFIFNKADGNIYVFDAVNHAFVRSGGKQHYIVDYIVDYVGYELPATFNARKALFLQLKQDYAECSLLKGDNYYDAYDFSFANIRSILSNEAEIYVVGNSAVKTIHDLQHGDTIYCKSNDCSYTFLNNNGTKSLEAQASGNSGNSVTFVDGIIWGVYDATEQNPSFPAYLKAMRGWPYLHFYDYHLVLAVVNFFSSGQLITGNEIEDVCGDNTNNTKLYAAFYDGQIYTAGYEGVISSTPLNNGDFIFNKADNSLYTYDAQNRKFVQEGNRHYVVDLIIDYVNTTTTGHVLDDLPDGSEEGVLILKAYDSYWRVSYCYFNAFMDGWYSADVALDEGICFANILSGFNDEACIYKNTAVGGGDTAIRVIHELREGDTFYNNMDGCTYMLSTNGNSKSFLRISEPVIPPVQDILHIGADMPDSPSAEGDKYLSYAPDESNFSGYLFTAPSDSDWGYGTQINDGKFYASLDNHKLYSFNGWGGKVFMPVTIPTGVPFLNKADNCLYVYDGSDFIKVGGN